MQRPSETIAAIATPHGPGAVAVVRLSGPEALDVAARLLAPAAGRRLRDGAPRLVASFRDPRTGEAVDRGLLHAFRAPRSFTGEHLVELHGHGGHVAPRRVLEAALAAGARLAEPGEFTRRALFNGKLDLLQVEATLDLIEARGDGLGRQAVYQLAGGLSRRLDRLRSALLDVMALVELQVDFPEEEVEVPADWGGRIESVRAEVAGLLDTYRAGALLRHGVGVVIAGAPNVGKSRLFNYLLGEERSIVTAAPGTTRDAIEGEVSIGGVAFRLVDTAGLREARDEVEAMGVDLSRRHLEGAQVALVVLEASRAPTAEELALIRDLGNRPRAIVLSKCDLLATPADLPVEHAVTEGARGWMADAKPQDMAEKASPGRDPITCREWGSGVWKDLTIDGYISQLLSPGNDGSPRFTGVPVIPTSALLGRGREEVLDALFQLGTGGVWVGAESPLLTRTRHRLAAEGCLENLDRALSELGRPSAGPEKIAADLRDAAESLGKIVGRISDEDVLDEIFSRFCIGK